MEAIGLALGVTPLIVESLETNPEPIDALQPVRSEITKTVMPEFYKDLQYEISMLKITLTQLIETLPISYELKEKLIHEHSLDATIWKSPSAELREALHRRLEPSFEPFTQTLEKILQHLAMLVNDADLPSFLSAENVRVCSDTPYAKLEIFFDTQLTTRRRLRLGWKKKERDDLIKGIEKYNKRLNKILTRSAEIRDVYVPLQRNTANYTHQNGLRQKMSELFREIVRVTCKCREKHEVRFGLSKCLTEEGHIKMDMIMNMTQNGMGWHWAESKINIYSQNSVSPDVSEQLQDERKAGRQRLSGSDLSGSTAVTDSISNCSTDCDSPTNAGQVPSATSKFADIARYESIHDPRRYSDPIPRGVSVDDVCQILRRGQKVRKAAQLFFFEGKLWHNANIDMEGLYSTSGDQLVAHLQREKMSMKDRKILQVILAQSVMFFPWTGKDLNKNSIAFHGSLSKPFATLLLGHSDDSNQRQPGSHQDGTHPLNLKPYKNEVLVGLATTLLEIELQKQIEDFQIAEDIDDADPSGFLTNFWTLVRVYKQQKYNMYKKSYGAIGACIKCDFDDIQLGLDSPQFLRQVYEKVVLPLEEELFDGFNINMPYYDDTVLESTNSHDQPAAATSHKQTHKKSVRTTKDFQPVVLERRSIDLSKDNSTVSRQMYETSRSPSIVSKVKVVSGEVAEMSSSAMDHKEREKVVTLVDTMAPSAVSVESQNTFALLSNVLTELHEEDVTSRTGYPPITLTGLFQSLFNPEEPSQYLRGNLRGLVGDIFVLASRSQPWNSARMRFDKVWARSHKPMIQPSQQRMYYTCRCGKPLYDDYSESKQGALLELKLLLSQCGIQTSHSVDVESQRTELSSSNSNISMVSPVNHRYQDVRMSTFGHSRTRIKLGKCMAEVEGNESEDTHKYVLTCIPHGRLISKLSQTEVCTVKSDKDFFELLREIYWESRSKLSLSVLRRVQSITFAKFDLYPVDLADVRSHPSLPSDDHKDQYLYDRTTEGVMPPIGSNLLVHLFENPTCTNNIVLPTLYSKVPKKLRGRLAPCPQMGISIGWGLAFTEGIDPFIFFGCGCIGFLLCFVIAVIWTLMRSDVQGGFGIGAFLLSFMVFCGGLLHSSIAVIR